MFEITLIVMGVCLLGYLGSRFWNGTKKIPSQPQEFGIPEGVSLRAQPLLTRAQAALYNLLCLAVHERYLVFAQVPLWSLIQVQAKDPKHAPVSPSFINMISRKRVDFVLVHPGTLAVAKVVELEPSESSSRQRWMRDKLAQMVYQAAGIPAVRLNPHTAHTVPSLANLLEVDPLE